MCATVAPQGRYQSVDRLDMYYEVHGDGPPLMLVHGALGTIDSCFAGLLPELARSREVIAIELQAHGHTPDVDRPLSYRQMAEDAAALLGVLGISNTDVFGFSMGGGVGLDLAMRYAVSIPPFTDHRRSWRWRPRQIRPTGTPFSYGTICAGTPRWGSMCMIRGRSSRQWQCGQSGSGSGHASRRCRAGDLTRLQSSSSRSTI